MKKGSPEFREAQRLRMKAWRATLSEEKKAEIRANQKAGKARPETMAKARHASAMRRAFQAESRRAEQNAYLKKYYRDNPDRNREHALKKKYGITLKQYNELHDAQKGLCAICEGPQSTKGRKWLGVDHCHTSGKIRALLCDQCNKGIGHFADIPERLEKAAAYIRERS